VFQYRLSVVNRRSAIRCKEATPVSGSAAPSGQLAGYAVNRNRPSEDERPDRRNQDPHIAAGAELAGVQAVEPDLLWQ
jgi:hypothetical protein